MRDPDMPSPRYHTKFFVETEPEQGTGFVHHVEGYIVQGMYYRYKPVPKPDESDDFHAKTELGWIEACYYPRSVDAICEA